MSERVYSKAELEHVATVAYVAGANLADNYKTVEETLRKLEDPASRQFYGLPEPLSIFDLFEQVRQHQDFVFGTIFVREDFPGANVPEGFSGRFASDMLAERGSLLIEDHAPEAS